MYAATIMSLSGVEGRGGGRIRENVARDAVGGPRRSLWSVTRPHREEQKNTLTEGGEGCFMRVSWAYFISAARSLNSYSTVRDL